MNIQDLSKNRNRIIKTIKNQITGATDSNIKSVMSGMVELLPSYVDVKPTAVNIDRLTVRVTTWYIKNRIQFTQQQNTMLDAQIEQRKNDSTPSSLRNN